MTFRQEVPVFTGADKSLNGQQQPVPKVGVFLSEFALKQ